MKEVRPSLVKMCSVVKAELYYGAERSVNPDKTRALLESFLNQYESLPFDDAAAREYGRLRAGLARRGMPIGSNDLMIASIAVSRSMIVVTHNISEFSRVPGILIEDWEE